MGWLCSGIGRLNGNVRAKLSLSVNNLTKPPELMLMLALLCGWSGSMLLSPFASTLAIATGMIAKSPRDVGLRWNGPFILTYYVIVMTALLIAGAML